MHEIIIVQKAHNKEDSFVFDKAFTNMELAARYVENHGNGNSEWILISNPDRKHDWRKYQNKLNPGYEFYIETVRVY